MVRTGRTECVREQGILLKNNVQNKIRCFRRNKGGRSSLKYTSQEIIMSHI
uniref:Uncharacterized protein n=1 Tax=Physcomitrium patens TaxID=3218 RepID=A0A2K1KV36_PHYPA|nr:hypothetical protein PHYPA_004600 [Physcomitrium patens]